MINFTYVHKPINFTSGYILKSKHFRVSIIKFPTQYDNPEKGTETVEIYLFNPKKNVVGTLVALHGLGTSNIPFLLWMGTHLANAGIRTVVPILPGNFTRTSHNSVSGKDFFSPDIEKAIKYWEHAIVDSLTTIEFLKSTDLWSENNCLFGFCLGGMISVILNAITDDFKQTILMTTGGDISTLIWHSPTLAFMRKNIKKLPNKPAYLYPQEKFINIFKKDIEKLKTFKTVEEMQKSDIHPFLKVDPIAYAKFVKTDKITFIEALFDRALPKQSRKLLWEMLGKPKKYVIPSGHVTWLPFQFFLAKFILKKMNVREFKRQILLLKKVKYDEK
ncbi:alpha/beta hydrolase [Thermosipho ferrireducens]|uniref:Alpha/beta hydrolase n=1 Tax=Thermosipho ferrireducens TaxID=2571116 RepID=A0ABX7S4M9_9BACT|nr:alpha/beta hydrolase [Thermosipho ferrireducens]QTA37377.1 alpha/beta hydrolase [Thermosipho ferrireducens]